MQFDEEAWHVVDVVMTKKRTASEGWPDKGSVESAGSALG
jgi:hypothetical protein